MVQPDEQVLPMREPEVTTRGETIAWSLLQALVCLIGICVVGALSQDMHELSLFSRVSITLSGLSCFGGLLCSIKTLAELT